MSDATTPGADQRQLIERDIAGYLAQHERKEILRLLTCGSVDDGKSHPDRTPVARLGVDPRRPARSGRARKQDRRLARGGTGSRACRRRSAGGTRTGHHHRRGLSVLFHRPAKVHHRGHPGPRAVHAQHGHGRVHLRRRDHPHRRRERGADADAATYVHRAPARHTAPCRRREQDGFGGLRRNRLRRHLRRLRRVRFAPQGGGSPFHSHIGAARRQRRREIDQHALVPGRIP